MKPYWEFEMKEDNIKKFGDNAPSARLIWGNSMKVLEDLKGEVQVQSIVTELPVFGMGDENPASWPSSYHHPMYANILKIPTDSGEYTFGLEESLSQYVSHVSTLFRSCKDLLAKDGTLWFSCRDKYSTDKQLMLIPSKIAIALQNEGWILRNDIVWKWDNPNPESAKDRLTRTHGHVFLFAHPDSEGAYKYNPDPIREPHETLGRPDHYYNKEVEVADGFMRRPKKSDAYHPMGRNKRDVWEVNLGSYMGNSISPWPYDLVKPMILAGTDEGDTVLDPLSGTALTGKVCLDHNRNYIGIDNSMGVRSEAIARLDGIKQSRKAKQHGDEDPVNDLFGE